MQANQALENLTEVTMKDDTFSDDKIAHLRNLIAIHIRRLQHLEIKAATYGIETPPHILVEIDDLTEKIKKLESEILELSRYSQQLEDMPPNVLDDIICALTLEQAREFTLFAEGKVLVVPKDFQRNSSYHNNILRELRKKKLIRPYEGGNWQPGSHIEVTRFGRMVYTSRREDIKRKVNA